MKTEQYTIVLRPEGDGLPAHIRLRGLLKESLRRWKLRAVSITPTAGEPLEAAQRDGQPTPPALKGPYPSEQLLAPTGTVPKSSFVSLSN